MYMSKTTFYVVTAQMASLMSYGLTCRIPVADVSGLPSMMNVEWPFIFLLFTIWSGGQSECGDCSKEPLMEGKRTCFKQIVVL